MTINSPKTEELILVDGSSASLSSSWWLKYDAQLLGSLSATARSVLNADCQLIVNRGVLPAGAEGWRESRTRAGLVMGAIQSGKTASMLGVGAKALDAGIQIVVVLAGTRVALWRQTYDRLAEQLVQVSEPTGSSTRAILLPRPDLLSTDSGISGPSDLYQLASARAARSLRDRTPLVLVVMKHGQHIAAAARMLKQNVYPHLTEPAHLLVLDDEADDGSILDAHVENNLDPSRNHLKQIPRHIVDLWSTRDHQESTASEHLYATYIGYTATPQANFLQADQNPLAPRDFIFALRTPSDIGNLEPRMATYAEPNGLRGYYTGGEVFYRRITGDGALCIGAPLSAPTDETDPDVIRRAWIADAMRAYLVAGALRLWRVGRKFDLHEVALTSFSSKRAAEDACPRPHTMLIHPSGVMRDHFDVAAELLEWGVGLAPDNARRAVASGERRLSSVHVGTDLDLNEADWRAWLERFRNSAMSVCAEFSLPHPPKTPPDELWPTIRSILINEVIPNVRIAIVNSDPEADDRPEFEPQMSAGGSWRSARNIFTVFVSGNVMARGLTLEGLTTTLFLRAAGDPTADSQMQMQRWFGYRGDYLDVCRVFVPQEQLSQFIQFHEADEALRAQIIGTTNAEDPQLPAPMVLEGENYRATSKITAISKVPLCPGATPFVSITNDGLLPDPNMGVFADVFSQPSRIVTANGRERGRILENPLNLKETARLLERLTYDSYSPFLNDPISSRWESLAHQLSVDEGEPVAEAPFFRPPRHATDDVARGSVVSPAHCPYAIAAYLRLWDACLTRRARGLFPTDNGEIPWSFLDLSERARIQPAFWIGVRFGRGDEVPATDPDQQSLPFPVRPMERGIIEGELTSRWGSRKTGSGPTAYLGDQLFDYHYHDGDPPSLLDGGPVWRPVGSPGLVLFHVVRVIGRPYLVAAIGVAIPLGGPDHFAARPRI